MCSTSSTYGCSANGPSASPTGAARRASIARAAADHERLRLTYVDRAGRRTERRVDPFRLVSTGRHWYLVGHDVDRTDWRTLRVDRITDAAGTGHRAELPESPDAAELVARVSGVAPYRWIAEVVIAAPADVVSARVPATVAVIAPHQDGALMTVGSDDLASLAGQLVALDLPFRALGPPELVALLRRAAVHLASHTAVP